MPSHGASGIEELNAYVTTGASPFCNTVQTMMNSCPATLPTQMSRKVTQNTVDNTLPPELHTEEDGTRLVEVWLGKDSTPIHASISDNLPALSPKLIDETLAPFTQPVQIQGINVTQVVDKPKQVEKQTQVDYVDDELIQLLQIARVQTPIREWEFINYSHQQISSWEGGYQAHMWGLDRRILGVIEDPAFHTFKLPWVNAPPAPKTVKDALRDCILNNGRNLPENPVLTNLRQRALGGGKLTLSKVGLTL